MQITFDTNNANDLAILNKFLAVAHGVEAQPQVAQNSGSTATGSTLSPEGSGVSGAGALGVPGADQPAPASEKKTRAKKPAATAEPEVKSETPVEATPASAASSGEKPTIDTVRAALQAFTTSKGVPAGIELLQKFGAGRISELAEEHYTAFIEGCAA